MFKKVLIIFITFIILSFQAQEGFAELLYKIKPICFDNSCCMLFVPTVSNPKSKLTDNLTVTKTKEQNLVTIEITNATTILQPEDLFFSEGDLKELQIVANPNNTVKINLYFKDSYNTSNLKIGNINNNLFIVLKPLQPYGMNYYLNTYTESSDTSKSFKETLVVTSRTLEKTTPVNNSKYNKNTVNEINKAFTESNYQSAQIYTNYKTTNESQDNVLLSKYYINNLTTNGKLFTISGVGILEFEKQFLLDNPKRMIFDIPNSIIRADLHNKELTLENGDKLKIAQFNTNTTRVVITSKEAAAYIPIYFPDSQKALLTSPKSLMTTDLPEQKANIVKTSFQKSGKTNNLIFEFDKPLSYSIKRTSDKLYIYFLNAEKYNDSNFTATIKQSPYAQTSIHLMKSTGIRLTLTTADKKDINTYLSPEGRVFKISSEEEKVPVVKDEGQTFQNLKKREGTIISTPKFNNPKGSKIIVLDAGHGGKDCGCTRDGIYEKDITLDVCDRLQTILRKKGYKVYMTRTNDTYISLEDRAMFNESINPAIFVSVHVNSCNDESPRGIETHYFTDDSLDLGNTINKSLSRKIPTTPNRGLLKSRFYVITHTSVPAILVEIGFISNTKERKELETAQRKQNTAEGIADGIIQYFNSKK